MIGLFFSQLILFAVTALIGFAVGWRLYVMATAGRRKADIEDLARLRAHLTEAQVRHASRTP